jgi:hypothetical protein
VLALLVTPLLAEAPCRVNCFVHSLSDHPETHHSVHSPGHSLHSQHLHQVPASSVSDSRCEPYPTIAMQSNAYLSPQPGKDLQSSVQAAAGNTIPVLIQKFACKERPQELYGASLFQVRSFALRI